MANGRRDFLRDIIIATGVVGISGGLLKTVLDDSKNYPEDFQGFDENQADGWKVADCYIPTQGDVIYLEPYSQISKRTVSKDEVKYDGIFKYKIRKRFFGTSERDLWDIRDGYVVLKRNK